VFGIVLGIMFRLMKVAIANSIPPTTRLLPSGEDVVDMEAMAFVDELNGFALGS
jgi:hypothetical protein